MPSMPRAERRNRRHHPILLALALAAAAGCGGAQAAAPQPQPTLAAHVIPYLPSTVRDLSADDVAPPQTLARLGRDLERWGFRAATERTFQGQSKRLQVVVSRTLAFDRASGARLYVDWVHRHAQAVLGSDAGQRPLRSRGRRGWLVQLAPCACHMATPAMVGFVSGGTRVSWLEVNGPTARPRVLRRLLARAP
jgi:hypothetical protein